MGMDMREDIFAEQSYGKLALQKFAPVDPNFRLYIAGWLGNGKERQVMKVTGAVFREALRGVRKGQLVIMVPDTSRSVHLTVEEMDEFEAATALGNADLAPTVQ